MLSAGEYDNKQSKKVPKTEENVKSLKKKYHTWRLELVVVLFN